MIKESKINKAVHYLKKKIKREEGPTWVVQWFRLHFPPSLQGAQAVSLVEEDSVHCVVCPKEIEKVVVFLMIYLFLVYWVHCCVGFSLTVASIGLL